MIEQLYDLISFDLRFHFRSVFFLNVQSDLCRLHVHILVKYVDLNVDAVVNRVNALVRPRASLPAVLLKLSEVTLRN